MYDEDDVRDVRGLAHGQARWGEPVRNGDAESQQVAADSRREAQETIHALMADVSAGIRVLRTRDGLALTDEQIRDRAANLVCGLIGNYRIERLEGVRFARPAVSP